MSVNVSEMVGESNDGWKGAVQSAVDKALKEGRRVVGVEVVNLTANVDNGRVTEYKANIKLAEKS